MTANNFPGYHDCKAVSIGLYSKLFTAVRNSDDTRAILKMPKNHPPTKKEEEVLRHERNILELLKKSPSTPHLYGEVQHDKSFFIAMEKIDSPSISTLLSQKKRFDLEEFLTFALAAITALENIHKYNVIHNDINDQNILYNPEKKECKIVDFNLSIATDSQKEIPENPELLEGMRPYISPEQSGRLNRGIDYRTDYYSLGVLFYRVLTGRLPFFSEDPLRLVYMHIETLPQPPIKWNPSIPEAVSDIILKLLAKEPEARYQSISSIRSDLTESLNRLESGKNTSLALGSHPALEKLQIAEKIYGRQEINEAAEREDASSNFTSSYEVPLKYCHYSLKWLGDEDWNENYGFLIKLYSEAMECAYLSENFDLVEKYGEIISSRSKNIFDELRAVKIKGLYGLYKGDLQAVISIFLDASKRLGFPLPEQPEPLHLLIGFSKVLAAKAMTRRSIEGLASLPEMDNKSVEAFIDLFNELGSAIYLSGKKSLFTLAVFKALYLIFRYGNSEKAPIVYVSFGVILVDMGAIEKGSRYGKLALAVADLFDNPKTRTATKVPLFSIIYHWKEELHKVSSLLMQNYLYGLEAENLQHAAHSFVAELTYSFYAGIPLFDLLEKISLNEKTISQLKNKNSKEGLILLRQAILKLANPRDPHPKQDRDEGSLDAANLGHLYAYKIMTGCILRDFKEAQKAIQAFPKYEEALMGHYAKVLFSFYKTLTLMALLESAPMIKQPTMRWSIKQGIMHFKKCAKHSPSNHLHKYLLLQAEWAKINQKPLEAEQFYEQAIASAAKGKFLNELALANELTCRFYFSRKMDGFALFFLKEALQCYENWGAQNKRDMLADEFFEQLQSQEPKAVEQTFKIESFAIDTTPIQKSVERSSSATLVDKLLKRLMSIAIEHTGTQKGFLLLAKGDEFFVEAEGDKRSGEIRLIRSAKIRPNSLPINVLQYVIREKTPLLLKEAFRDPHFKDNSYIENSRVKSILCLPLLNRGRVTAILYLENTLTKNAFTEERSEQLHFLATQLATSIDNARLYEEVKKLNLSYRDIAPNEFLSFLCKKQSSSTSYGDRWEQSKSSASKASTAHQSR